MYGEAVASEVSVRLRPWDWSMTPPGAVHDHDAAFEDALDVGGAVCDGIGRRGRRLLSWAHGPVFVWSGYCTQVVGGVSYWWVRGAPRRDAPTLDIGGKVNDGILRTDFLKLA